MASSPLSTVCTHCGVKLHPVLEEFASGPAIAKRFAAAPGRQKNHSHESRYASTSSAQRQKETKAPSEILTSAGEALGVSTAFLVNVLDPEMIVVGGGLGLAGGLYWDAFQQSLPRAHLRR